MEKDNHLSEIFVTIFFLTVLVVGYFFVKNSVHAPPARKAEKNVLTDAKTGDPIPKEVIAKIAKKQAGERTIYVLSGKVENKLRDSLQISVSFGAQKETRTIQVKFSPKMIFLKEIPLAGYEKDSSATEEKEISFADVNIGDMVTTVFSRGVLFYKINEASTIEITNLIVNMPLKEVLEKD